MAEKKAAGSGLKKKLGPLPYWGWAAVGGATYLIYRYIKARNAAAAAAAASGITGGNLPASVIGNPLTPAGTTPTTTGAGNFASTAAWVQAALTYLTSNGLDAADAYNGITSWLNGSCVSEKAYNGIAAALDSSTVGLPPGYSVPPTLYVCPSVAQAPASGGAPPASTPPPAPSAPLFPGLGGIPGLHLNPGESVVATQWDATLNEFIVLTNEGGIYDVAPSGAPGSVFYGSYLGLPAADRQGVRSFVQLIINPDGTYTAVGSDGSQYHFAPGVPQV
jgi:hypothetical protein